MVCVLFHSVLFWIALAGASERCADGVLQQAFGAPPEVPPAVLQRRVYERHLRNEGVAFEVQRVSLPAFGDRPARQVDAIRIIPARGGVVGVESYARMARGVDEGAVGRLFVVPASELGASGLHVTWANGERDIFVATHASRNEPRRFEAVVSHEKIHRQTLRRDQGGRNGVLGLKRVRVEGSKPFAMGDAAQTYARSEAIQLDETKAFLSGLLVQLGLARGALPELQKRMLEVATDYALTGAEVSRFFRQELRDVEAQLVGNRLLTYGVRPRPQGDPHLVLTFGSGTQTVELAAPRARAISPWVELKPYLLEQIRAAHAVSETALAEFERVLRELRRLRHEPPAHAAAVDERLQTLHEATRRTLRELNELDRAAAKNR